LECTAPDTEKLYAISPSGASAIESRMVKNSIMDTGKQYE
jgi:hypothetical protein